MSRSFAVCLMPIPVITMLGCSSIAHAASRNPIEGKTVEARVEMLVKMQNGSGFFAQRSETLHTQTMKWTIDRQGNVYYFSEQSENGKYDQGEVLLLNKEIDLASHTERVDPRVLSNFRLTTMMFRTSLNDHVLTISGVLDMTGKNSGARFQTELLNEIAFSPTFTSCSIRNVSIRRTISEPAASVSEASLRRQIQCTVSSH